MLFVCIGCNDCHDKIINVGVLKYDNRIMGTAFAINNNKIITAHHVLPNIISGISVNNYAINIKKHKSFGYDAVVIYVDNIPPELSIIPTDNYICRGMDIIIIGYAVEHGVATYKVKYGKILSRIATSALIEPGMSGSPVINVSNGKVIAIAYSFIPDLGVTEIIPIGELK